MHVRVGTVPDRLTDPGPGQHLWIINTAHKLPDDAARNMANGRDPGDIIMDRESMLMPPSVGCYKCEEPFSPRLYFRKCTGSMEVQ